MRIEIATEHKIDLFTKGAHAAGFSPLHHRVQEPIKGEDCLIVWNRKTSNESQIARYEKAGCMVIVAENGYMGKDAHGNRLIALALNRHLGLGKWPHLNDRWCAQNINLRKWREPGEEIIILAQRGIGFTSQRPEWSEKLAGVIRGKTHRSVKVRHHPGKQWRETPLEPDLENAYCVVTYSSAAAIQAIVSGVPAIYMMPEWIGKDAACFDINMLDYPYRGSRSLMLDRVSSAQWSHEEIASGKAFTHLKEFHESLSRTNQLRN